MLQMWQQYKCHKIMLPLSSATFFWGNPMATRTRILDSMMAESARRIEQLQKNLEFEERYYGELKRRREDVVNLEHWQSTANEKSASKNGDVPQKTAESLPEKIREILKEAKKPLRARDIARALKEKGEKTSSKKGLLPNVVSALRRRTDLFQKVARGTYKLKGG